MVVEKEKKQAIKEILESNMIVHSRGRGRKMVGEFEATLGSEQRESSNERGRKEEKSTADKAVPLLCTAVGWQPTSSLTNVLIIVY